jgi:hypothetical protein
MPRGLKWLVWLCLAVVIFTACTAAAADHFSDVLVPLGLVHLTIGTLAILREARRSAEQPVALLSLLLSRAPPLHI